MKSHHRIDIHFQTHEKIIYATEWIVIQIVGNSLLWGMIQFDRFGSDPMKRRIVDQVQNSHKNTLIKIKSLITSKQLYTIGCILSIICNLVLNNILGFFVLCNTQLHPFLIATYKFGLMSASSYFSMSVIEVAILKFLTIFIWKRVPPIEDQFTITFLTIINIFVSVLVGSSRFLTGEGLEYDAKLLGADPLLVPKPALGLK